MKRRLLLALIVALIASSAASDTWYLNNTNDTGAPACTGVDKLMTETAGSSVQVVTIREDLIDYTWNADNNFFDETRSGDWGCAVRVTVGSGGGAPNKIQLRIRRVNSSCVFQEDIINEESDTLTKGATQTVNCTTTNASVTFGSSDYLIFQTWKTQGGQIINLRYDGASPDDSHLIVPAASAADPPGMLILQ